MPRIIPVLDVLRGRAVHARAGRREDYRPLRSTLRRGSDPLALAAAVGETFRPAALYLADLDAIAGGAPDLDLYRRLAPLVPETWIDCGLRVESGLRPIMEADVGRVVVGLETVAGRDAVRRIVDLIGPGRVVFSLDLREGRPLFATGADWGTDDPRRIIGDVVEDGIEAVILLDLARVGTARGVGTIELLRVLKGDHPEVEWVAGGGVAGVEDIRMLGQAGASAVLVASAIHDGRISPSDAPILD